MKQRIVTPRIEFLTEPDREVALHVSAVLERAGHQAWLVGGCVRDLALGRTPKDLDVATDAEPDRVRALFPRTVAVGAAFGTVLVLVDDHEVQVTTFRREGNYRDGRRPEEVCFGTSLEEDAARRDFTCNALFLAPNSGEVRDPTGGLVDLRDGILRCVGDPAERFREDGLRILRMARFAAGYGLDVEDTTLRAARAERGSLRGVSAERVLHELGRMAVGPAAGRAAHLLAEAGAFEVLFGEVPTYPDRVEALAGTPGVVRFLCALFEDPAANRADAEVRAARADFFQRLRLSRETARACEQTWDLVRELSNVAVRAHRLPRARRLRLLRADHFDDAVAVLRTAPGSPRALLDDLEEEAAALGEQDLRPAPLLGAEDLIAAGVPRGPELGRALRRLEDAQLEGRLRSREEALAWVASARRKATGEPSREREQGEEG